MATKRKGATTERSGGEAATSARRRNARVTQDALPGMTTGMAMSESPVESPVRASQVVARRGARGAPLEVTLRIAPTNGPRQPARARQAPAVTPPAAPEASAAPAAPAAPKRPRKTSSRRFGDLRDALAEGWEIVQPIFARPLWSAADDSQTAFNFVLRRDQATRLLTVPESRTVERFIATHSLKVDYRR
jgi:hypothetical protein